MKKVFISHSTKDDEFVNELSDALTSHKIKVFVDHKHIGLGEFWPDALRKALNECEQMIAVVSPDSIDSAFCKREWFTFEEQKKEVIPVWIRGEERYFQFATAQGVDLRNRTANKARKDGIDKIVEYLTDGILSLPLPEHRASPKINDPLPSEIKFHFPLKRRAEKTIGIVTGNIGELKGVDILVNSENTRLVMDRPTEETISGALNNFSAFYDSNGKEIDYPVENELKKLKHEIEDAGNSILPAMVVETSSGSRINDGIRHILHAVSVVPTGRARGYHAATQVQLGRCIINTLKKVDELNATRYSNGHPITSIVFPIFGTGKAKQKILDVAPHLVERAIEYLEYEETKLRVVYFIAYTQPNLRELISVVQSFPDDLNEMIEV